MRRKTTVGLFVVGTDTNVGKTYVAAQICASLRRAGLNVGVYKPVASGCRAQAGAGSPLVADDAVALWQAAGKPDDLQHVCPQRFAAPLAPHLSAQAEGRKVDAALLRSGFDYWRERSDVVVVEGAGGLLSPISDDEFVADLCEEFALPLVVVAANKLGAINQTLQTLVAATTFRRGLSVAGIVLNRLDVNQDASVLSNRDELTRLAVPPVLADVPFGGNIDSVKHPQVDWFALARGDGLSVERAL